MSSHQCGGTCSDNDDDDNNGGYEIQEISAPIGSTQSNNDSQSNLDFRMGGLPTSEYQRDEAYQQAIVDQLTATNRQQRNTGKYSSKYYNNATSTGPKGVLADYKEAEKNLKSKLLMERIYRERQINKQANVALQLNTDKPNNSNTNKLSDSDNGDSDSDFDNDREFEQYRQQRITALQNSLPVFGEHERLESKFELAELVKSIHPAVSVVIHLYENHLESCIRLNFALEALAIQFPHVKFCRIKSTDAIPGYSEIGLPTLLIYRGGELITSAVRVTEAFTNSKEFTDLEVAKLLQAKGILSLPTNADGGNNSNSNNNNSDIIDKSLLNDELSVSNAGIGSNLTITHSNKNRSKGIKFTNKPTFSDSEDSD